MKPVGWPYRKYKHMFKIKALLGGPHDQDYGILGSILGSPRLGNYQVATSIRPHKSQRPAAPADRACRRRSHPSRGTSV